MHLSKFSLNIQYEKGLLKTKADSLFCLRSLGKTTVPADADIPTNPLHSIVKHTERNSIDKPDAYFALITDAASSFVSITSDEIRLLQNDDDSCRTIRARLGERKRV